MATTPHDQTTARTGRPPVVGQAAWQAARDELLVREKAHTREGDAIAAARRRLPMVEIDGAVEVAGKDGPVPFLDVFEGRDELVVYKHMWHDGAPHEGQCEGCTVSAWGMKDAVYLNARGVSFAILTTGRWAEVEPYVAFMGYTEPWYSVRGLPEPVGGAMGYVTCFLRDGDRVFLTYSTTGRGVEPASGSFGVLDMTRPGRGEAWEEGPEGRPEGRHACWYWRSDAGGNPTWDEASRPCRSGPGPGRLPSRPSAGPHDRRAPRGRARRGGRAGDHGRGDDGAGRDARLAAGAPRVAPSPRTSLTPRRGPPTRCCSVLEGTRPTLPLAPPPGRRPSDAQRRANADSAAPASTATPPATRNASAGIPPSLHTRVSLVGANDAGSSQSGTSSCTSPTTSSTTPAPTSVPIQPAVAPRRTSRNAATTATGSVTSPNDGAARKPSTNAAPTTPQPTSPSALTRRARPARRRASAAA